MDEDTKSGVIGCGLIVLIVLSGLAAALYTAAHLAN
jgi:hypothetical protein